MKFLLSLFVFATAPLAQASLNELAVIANEPNQAHPFIQEVLKERIVLIDSREASDYTTGILYFAWKNKVESAATVEILSQSGTATFELVHRAAELASLRAKIALVPVGPASERICQSFAAFPETIFLMGLGSEGREFDAREMPSCYSPNILFVSGLNGELTDLQPNQSWGDLARLAVPYVSLRDNAFDRRDSRAFGMGVLAGKMAQMMRANPELWGPALIEKFLAEGTRHLPALEGKIRGARALTEFEK